VNDVERVDALIQIGQVRARVIEVARPEREHKDAPTPCVEGMNKAPKQCHQVVRNHAGFNPSPVHVRYAIGVLLHAEPEERQREHERHANDGVEP